jgi:hypothetical protein
MLTEVRAALWGADSENCPAALDTLLREGVLWLALSLLEHRERRRGIKDG